MTFLEYPQSLNIAASKIPKKTLIDIFLKINCIFEHELQWSFS